MSLPELLQWVKFGQKTGTAVFERRGIVKKVFIESGLIISASSNDPKEYLGQILLCFGWVTEEDLNRAFKLQKERGVLLGKVLLDDFGLEQDQILRALRVKIEETIYDIFLWDDGKFIYSDGIPQLQQHDRLDAPITIDQVTFEGARRHDEWREFKKSVPTDDVVFKIKGEKRTLDTLSKDFITQKIYDFIDGEKSIHRLLLETHAPEYRAMESFAKLFWGGFIEPVKKSVSRPAKAHQDTPSLLKEAMELFKAKELEKAHDMIEQFVQVNPANEEGQTLYRMVKEAYLKQLFEKCLPELVPELTMDISQLSEKVFNSREGFIASRVNGQWDVKSLAMISPLGELESLRILNRLVDEGVVNLKKKTQH